MSLSTRLMEQFLPTLRRVVIENVTPEIDCGRFPVKRTVGEPMVVRANIFADGHDLLGAHVLFRKSSDKIWEESPMHLLQNDLWEGQFTASALEPYTYTVQAWIDVYGSWLTSIGKKIAAGQDVTQDFLIGQAILSAANKRAKGPDSKKLSDVYARLLKQDDAKVALAAASDPQILALMLRYRDRSADSAYSRELIVEVDREKARFSSWYEMFPRSAGPSADVHGSFRDVIATLDYVAGMGFDVLYLPPIHPIGKTERKGRNNTSPAGPGDTGSPWAIGSEEGGHKAIHSELGTLTDLKLLEQEARSRGIELALDIAFQCSPDHPYVKEHREWFRLRPDGSVQYAENPPKKYQDIYPLDFENSHVGELAAELKSVVMHWITQGIRIFRVDNPHTKPFAFWEWLIHEVRREHPEVIFLSEAFTRPASMYELSKLGFTQSYTYFTWKNSKAELTEYFNTLSSAPVNEFFRPNLWPNTPDILHAELQKGGRPVFIARLILAATLSSSYGIYGPPFELMENRPVREGSEEYLDSEKYQIRAWDRSAPGSLRDLIRRVNQIRRESVALQSNWRLSFHPTDNDQLIAYSKVSEDFADRILMVVNLDPVNTQSGWIDVQSKQLNLEGGQRYELLDLLTGARYTWQGSRNYLSLNPGAMPAHIFRILPTSQ